MGLTSLASTAQGLIDPRSPDRGETSDLASGDTGVQRPRKELGDRFMFALVSSLRCAQPIAVRAKPGLEALSLVSHGRASLGEPRISLLLVTSLPP
jgi:hypothetical protein